MHGRNLTACCFSARKRLLGRVTGDRYSAGVYNRYTAEHKHKLCSAESDWTRTGPASRVDPARAGSDSDRDGRERPAADGRAGPFRPERTPFFPSHSSLRDSFHYGKNDIVLIGYLQS